MSSTMTYEQAREQAIKMHQQGMTYPKIEQHFRQIGYKSPRTKDFVGALAIRHMVTKADQQTKKEIKAEEEEIRVVTAGFRDTVRKLSEVPGIDETTFLNLMKALISQQERQGKRA